ncbi:hypothetical protein [Bradyrhizobium zhanjiangense]|uniref:Uncharacterized protein n=1 Tax=Bradyrhizobium zhanjiangense TaxID=1325107 RepID=A0A4Q0SLX4_9BRAD|nr:hypothetical protein [Bradyrhizobium zhanjiangense]RXH39558.1 hypothetical protein XH94_16740 [Bradyrhizobium zhanjiangense]
MLNPTECREMAMQYRHEANKAGASPRRASLLRNISHSLSALSHQLEMLADDRLEADQPQTKQ